MTSPFAAAGAQPITQSPFAPQQQMPQGTVVHSDYSHDDKVIFAKNNGHSGVVSSYLAFIDPKIEQSTKQQTTNGAYKLQVSGGRGILLDYSFSEDCYISGVEIGARVTYYWRSDNLHIRLLYKNAIVHTTSNGGGTKTIATPVLADQIQLTFTKDSSDTYTQFNYITVRKLVPATVQALSNNMFLVLT